MNTEFEAKFYPIDKDNFRKTLATARAKLIQPEALMPMALFTNWENNFTDIHYLRVRDEFGKVMLAAKKHAREGEYISDQKELETEVGDFEATVAILKSAGLNGDTYQEKYREVWELDSAEIVIDTWPNLKPYIEIEAASEETVRSVAGKLGFDWTDAIFTSVVEVYMKEHDLTKDEVKKVLKDWRFD